MFVNCSNHSSQVWGKNQLRAAQVWGEVRDYPFPCVEAAADKAAVQEMARHVVDKILALRPDAVLCQGEYILNYAIVKRLKEFGIVVVAACSERMVEEQQMPDGSTQKVSRFSFVRFREY